MCPAKLGGVSEHESFRALTELAPDFVALLDTHGMFVYVSPAVRRVLGFDAAELVGRHYRAYTHPADIDVAERDFHSLLDSRDIVSATLRFRHKDGGWRVLETLGRNYADIPSLGGILISTRDVTERIEQDRVLREALAEARDLYNRASCGYHSLDEQALITRINDTELDWLGYARSEVQGVMNFRELLTAKGLAVFDRTFPQFKRSGRVDNLEFDLRCKDGRRLPVLVNATAVYDTLGRYCGSRSSVFDITERKRSEWALQRMNRALRVRSGVSTALVRAGSEAELLQAVCRVIVEPGGYRMAWVGSAQEDRDRSVRVEAHAGIEDGYLQTINISWSDSERGRGPTGTAIRVGQPQINRDFLNNPHTLPWREDALARGYQSSIALPLKEGERSFGVLTIYASEPDAFDAAELDLMLALADDLAFGIRSLRASELYRQSQIAVERLAYFDALTGLPNRTRLMQQLNEALQPTGTAGPCATLAVLTLSVDRYSDMQAGLGIHQADQLIGQIANRLQIALVEGERLSRIANDSFAVLQCPGDPASAADCAQRVRDALLRPFHSSLVSLTIHLSIGAALAPTHGEEAEVLLVRSGSAARRAKRSGSGYHLYDGLTENESPAWLALITDLRRAIEQGQIQVHYQPKLAVASGTVVGAEALVRWTHPTRGAVSPAVFVPLAERTGLIQSLSAYLLDSVMAQIRDWRARGFELPVAINVSPRNLDDPAFVDVLLQRMDQARLGPGALEIEITESTLMEDPQRVREQLLRLDERGVGISIDDFGTGYSSLNYVATLPVQSLKIDRSFVVRMNQSERVHGVVTAIISLAQALGMRTIAEGVDDAAQLRSLQALGCEQVQGFLFSPALAAADLEQWVRQRPAVQSA